MKIPRVTNHSRPKIGNIATISNNKFIISSEGFKMMEIMPNFALPNQFFVWVAKKVFAY